ncbi:hypothetical protein GQ53DRAFT_793115 [Thozetella sp. PMI_491]|nr:hypothetical protein GQ53DRAFT_793115 [Thozetella sp. PMI_491]
MGLSQSVSAQTEIKASPDHVRSVFSDFSRMKQWSQWDIQPADASKSSTGFKAGDRLKVDLNFIKLQPILLENSEETFQWDGGLYPIFAGKHTFTWTPSEKLPGGTTFTQREEFRGLLAFMMSSWLSFRKSTLVNWDQFNADLKKEAERSSA